MSVTNKINNVLATFLYYGRLEKLGISKVVVSLKKAHEFTCSLSQFVFESNMF